MSVFNRPQDKDHLIRSLISLNFFSPMSDILTGDVRPKHGKISLLHEEEN